MLSKKLYDYRAGDLNSLTPKEITSFTYANSGWKDQLVSVNDEELTYDENGTRFSKTVNGTTTQFTYLGGLLMAQKTGEDVIFFPYGAGSVPVGFVYNGTQYFYVTNQLCPVKVL